MWSCIFKCYDSEKAREESFKKFRHSGHSESRWRKSLSITFPADCRCRTAWVPGASPPPVPLGGRERQKCGNVPPLLWPNKPKLNRSKETNLQQLNTILKFWKLDCWILKKSFLVAFPNVALIYKRGEGSFEGHAGFDLPLAYYCSCTAAQTIWTTGLNSAHLFSSIYIFSVI